MMTDYFLAIDQGTSSSRALVFDSQGNTCFTSQHPVDIRYPEPGWVEQDAEQIWQSVLSSLAEVKQKYPDDDFIACGITNQRETIVAWNKASGDILAPAIVWQDRRTQDLCRQRQEDDVWITEKTGLRLDPYFSASKIHWLLQHNPQWLDLIKKDELAIATIDAFLLWRLTQGRVYATDITNASRTMLMNIQSGQWDQNLLDFWEIPVGILPEIKSSDALFGRISQEIFDSAPPISGMIGDQQAALIGQHCFREGMAKATFGTGAFLLVNTGTTPVQSKHGLLTTVAYEIKNQRFYGLEGSIYHAGTAIKWLRDELNIIKSADESEMLANQLNDNGGVYFLSSYTGMGAPRWDDRVGAKLAGLSLDTTPAHIARAVLEGVAYQTREVFSAMRADGQKKLAICRVDGGMAKNQWFLHFLANQCQCLIEKSDQIELTAKGAALLAGIGAGFYQDISQLAGLFQSSQKWSPDKQKETVDSDYHRWLKAVGLVDLQL